MPLLDIAVTPGPRGSTRIEVTIEMPSRLANKVAAVLLFVGARLQASEIENAIETETESTLNN
jgi:hypothetical protein